MDLYVHYGCGSNAPDSWMNFDASPTLRIQHTPVIGTIFKNSLSADFPANVKYGNIIKGLPIADNTCAAIYCSHILEHLSLTDFKTALANTYKMLKPGGTFRCVVPDLEVMAREYIQQLDAGDKNAAVLFVGDQTILGSKTRQKGVSGLVRSFLGNSRHLWMWDSASLQEQLREAGFKNIRPCLYGDSSIEQFKTVETQEHYHYAIGVECTK